jgi:hypothetical protein
MTAAWAYLAATLDDASVRALLPEACAWIDRHVIGGEGDAKTLRSWSAGEALRSLRRLGISTGVTESAASRYSVAGAPPLPGLPTAGPTYRRNVWGTLTFESQPVEQRRWSRWAGSTISALYWTDGQRPLDAVAKLVAAETGKKAPSEAFFEAMVEAGLARKV